jgi:hypothetical protein
MKPSSAQAGKHPKPYIRHLPETTLLYITLLHYLETWLAARRAENPDKNPIPLFIEKALRAFLECGILANGFILVKCEGGCGHLHAVAFSCKQRGFCPSCAGKRMNETSIHLTENVLPQVPYRQWVVTFPVSLRYWMASSQKLTSLIHGIVTKVISSYYLYQAEEHGIKNAVPGGITFLQRFGSALNLHLHAHILMIEGVYSMIDGVPKFHQLSGPGTEEVEQTLEAIAERVIRMLRRRKLLPEDGTEVEMATFIDKAFGEFDGLAAASAASGNMRIAFGDHRGEKVRRIGGGFGYEEETAVAKGPRCATVNGFSLHADRFIGQQEREKLRELICYAARGPFSHDRLSLLDATKPDGDLVYRPKTPWKNGLEAIVLSPTELIEKLVALIPPKNSHLTRYFGVLASHSRVRPLILLKPGVKKGFVTELGETDEEMTVRLTWARMLKRTFRSDIMTCPLCGATIKSRNCIAVNEGESIRKILRHLGLQEHPPPLTPARWIMGEFSFDQSVDGAC